jgi:hypothetical protein
MSILSKIIRKHGVEILLNLLIIVLIFLLLFIIF